VLHEQPKRGRIASSPRAAGRPVSFHGTRTWGFRVAFRCTRLGTPGHVLRHPPHPPRRSRHLRCARPESVTGSVATSRPSAHIVTPSRRPPRPGTQSAASWCPPPHIPTPTRRRRLTRN